MSLRQTWWSALQSIGNSNYNFRLVKTKIIEPLLNISNLFTFLVLNGVNMFFCSKLFFNATFCEKSPSYFILWCIFSEKWFFLSFLLLLFTTPKYYSFNPTYFRKGTLKFILNSIWSLNLLCNRIKICSTNLV